MTEQSNLRTINNSKNQQHPFHLLGSSKLPVFMAAFAGGLAITLLLNYKTFRT